MNIKDLLNARNNVRILEAPAGLDGQLERAEAYWELMEFIDKAEKETLEQASKVPYLLKGS